MSNGHEKAGHIQYLFFPALVIHDPDPFDRLSVPDNFPGFGMKKDFNICRMLYAVNHGFGCPELTLTYQQIDFFTKLGQIGGFFGSCISAAYDGYILAAEEDRKSTRLNSSH